MIFIFNKVLWGSRTNPRMSKCSAYLRLADCITQPTRSPAQRNNPIP